MPKLFIKLKLLSIAILITPSIEGRQITDSVTIEFMKEYGLKIDGNFEIEVVFQIKNLGNKNLRIGQIYGSQPYEIAFPYFNTYCESMLKPGQSILIKLSTSKYGTRSKKRHSDSLMNFIYSEILGKLQIGLNLKLCNDSDSLNATRLVSYLYLVPKNTNVFFYYKKFNRQEGSSIKVPKQEKILIKQENHISEYVVTDSFEYYSGFLTITNLSTDTCILLEIISKSEQLTFIHVYSGLTAFYPKGKLLYKYIAKVRINSVKQETSNFQVKLHFYDMTGRIENITKSIKLVF